MKRIIRGLAAALVAGVGMVATYEVALHITEENVAPAEREELLAAAAAGTVAGAFAIGVNHLLRRRWP